MSLEKRPNYNDNCQSCCAPTPTAVKSKYDYLHSSGEYRPQCPTGTDKSNPQRCHNRGPGNCKNSNEIEEHSLEDNNPLLCLQGTPEEEQLWPSTGTSVRGWPWYSAPPLLSGRLKECLTPAKDFIPKQTGRNMKKFWLLNQPCCNEPPGLDSGVGSCCHCFRPQAW